MSIETLIIVMEALNLPESCFSVPMVPNEQDLTKTQEETRKRIFRRNRTRAAIASHIAKIWECFPKGGLALVKMESLSDNKVNYGVHQRNLGYDMVDIANNTNFPVGTKSLGLRYENEHTCRRMHREMCEFSAKNLEFLQHIHTSVRLSYPKLKFRTDNYMRVNLVVGAKTGEHTDTMRGATPNFMLIQQKLPEDPVQSPFQLRIRLFPRFRVSVVKYDGQLWIPFRIRPSELVMIGVKNNQPHFYMFPTATIDELEAYGDIPDYIIVGIKAKKLQVLPWEYSVHYTTKTLPMKPLEQVLEDAKANRAVIPKKVFRYESTTDKWIKFYGWMHSHSWVVGTYHLLRRIHVFYRAIREETSSARWRKKIATDEPINYTVYKKA